MITQETIAEVVDAQLQVFLNKNLGVQRIQIHTIPVVENFVTVITGIRRCGKSILLLQLLKKHFNQPVLLLNFEDPRLVGFNMDDFRRLDAEIKRREVKVLFFDEVQSLENWELYVRQKLDEGFQIFVTGSNATLLSKELGTKLTGRHLSIELFPFSFLEYLKLKKRKPTARAAKEYLENGGFPEFLKTGIPTILHHLLDDILYRDIAVRYGVRDVLSLRKMAVYLLSNIGKPVSANGLKAQFDIKASSTILEYFSYLENAYIVQFVPKFSYSLKVQIRNPKKVYAIDIALSSYNSVRFTDDWGRKLENLVFIELRRKYKEIYYFQEQKECDFIVFEREKLQSIVQVCYELNPDNLKRELAGAFEAMRFFKQKKALLVTLDQETNYEEDGMLVEVVPLHLFLKRDW